MGRKAGIAPMTEKCIQMYSEGYELWEIGIATRKLPKTVSVLLGQARARGDERAALRPYTPKV